MDNQTVTVGKPAPDFDLPCTRVRGSTRSRAVLADYRDRWLVMVFYPRDFSLICPTELTALSDRIQEFQRRGCDLLGVSTDSIESHERWLATPRAQGGLGPIGFPLASDADGCVSRAYGVLVERQHVALRGVFVVDPNGILQYQVVHNLSVGRRSEDILRVLAAFETGGMCAEDWCEDCITLDATQELVSGSVISHYRIETEVGSGAFASVFRAHDTTLDRTVALKVFKPGALASPLAALAEARSAAALNHPGVCTIFAVEHSEGVPLIAMEYLDGRPLSTAIEGRAMSPEETAAIGHQVALGMAAAHDLGIVHGDLKPANIMLTSDGIAKVTDFGLSRRVETARESDDTEVSLAAKTGEVAGTPSYMSPEQSRGEHVTPASDVFSFGVVLYEMLSGQRMFIGKNVLQLLSQISNVEPDRYAAEVPEPFAQILQASLVRDSGDRVITMKQVAELLG